MVSYAGRHKEKVPQVEHPLNTTNTTITPTTGAGQVDFAMATALEEQTRSAIDKAISRMATAVSRFREATGAEFDGANLELTSAQDELRSVYTRLGNVLTPQKASLIMDLLYDVHCKLRSEYPVH